MKLPKPFIKRLKVKAAKEDITMQQLIQSMLELALAKMESPQRG